MKVIVIAPHADDEILGVGGTISKYVSSGDEVYICVVTCGHLSMFTEEYLTRLRGEVLRAHQFLGIKKTYFLEFPAVMLSETPIYEINAALSNVISEVKPDIAFIPHFGDMHNDHYIVAQAGMVALRPIGNNRVKSIYSYETLSETEWNIPHARNAFIPNTWVDISDCLDKKVESMSIFDTQVYEFPHPRSLEAIEHLARLRGSNIGVQAAEAFCLIRQIK